MKMIQNKNFIQKMSIILLMILCFNFVCPIKANAAEDSLAASVGGVLLKPISDLLVGIGDALVQVSHDLVIFDLAKETDNR